jgi:hypothetical protein
MRSKFYQEFCVDVEFALEFLCRVNLDSVAGVSNVHAASIFRVHEYDELP